MLKDFTLVHTREGVSAALQKIDRSPMIAIDLETTGLDFMTNENHGIAIANGEHEFYFTHDAVPVCLDNLNLFSVNKQMIGHNIAFDLHFLRKHRVDFPAVDTMVAQFLIDENQRLGLKELAHTKLGIKEPLPDFNDLRHWAKRVLGKAKLEDVTIFDIPLGILAEYAARDTRLTYDLWLKTQAELKQEEMEQQFFSIEMPFLRLLLDMEEAGFFIDEPKLHKTNQDFIEIRDNALERFLTITEGVNPNSGKQLGEYLFGRMKYPVQGYTEKGAPSTDIVALSRLLPKDKNGAVTALLEYRKYDKLIGTYTEPFIAQLVNGRLYGNFNQTGTVTGRLCVDGDTLLETSSGTFCIRDYKPIVGDRITTHTGKQQRILNKFYKGQELMYEVTISSGDKITVTAGHRFLTPDGWKHLRDIRVGDILLTHPYSSDGAQTAVSEEDTGRERLCVPAPAAQNVNERNREEVQPVPSHNDGYAQGLQAKVCSGNQSSSQGQPTQADAWEHSGQSNSKGYLAEYTTGLVESRIHSTKDGGHAGNSPTNSSQEPSGQWFSKKLNRQAAPGAIQGSRDAGYVGSIFSGNNPAGRELRYKPAAVLQTALQDILDSTENAVVYPEAIKENEETGRGRGHRARAHRLGHQQVGGSAGTGLTGRRDTAHPAVPVSNSGWEAVPSRLLPTQAEFNRGDKRVYSQLQPSVGERPAKVPGYPEGRLQASDCPTYGYIEECGEGCAAYIELPVVSIVPVGVRDVWDIEVEEDHSYVAHGFINHNSSSGPNLQNIPAGGETGAQVRDFFSVPPGYAFLDIDYSQLELRILAHYTRDVNMLSIFFNNGDPHQTTVDLLTSFGYTIHRRDAKTVNFGWAYGVGPRGLCDQIEKASGMRPKEEDAKAWLKGFEKAYPGAPTWRWKVIEYARDLGYVRTIAGRRRRLPDITSSDQSLSRAAERQAVNSIIQGSASDIIKHAMLEIYPQLPSYGAKFLAQVHDEICVEVPQDVARELGEMAAKTMVAAGEYYQMRVPLVAEPGYGTSWSNAKH